jgi:hypothetical protein
MKKLIVSATLLLSLCLPDWAETKPQVTGTSPIEVSTTDGIQPAINRILKESSGDVWIAYAVPSISSEHQSCCSNESFGCCGACSLDDHKGCAIKRTNPQQGSATLASFVEIFLKFQRTQLRQVRMFSPDCVIDAAGMTVYWLNGVKDDQSVAYLSQLIDSDVSSRSNVNGLIAAIAFHSDPTAGSLLESLLQPEKNINIRNQATFWIGTTRGSHGLDVLLGTLATDHDGEFLNHVVFAISQSTEEQRALNELVRLARNDSRQRVREQALFWLAQKAGKKAASTITEAIENDPDTEVKKKAVFALSQMPKDESIPLLIDQAKRNKNPVVRKEAIFWLGQSGDPRALDFISSVLAE